MKPNHLFVDAAPRDLEGLSNMTAGEQTRVLAELRSMSKGGLLTPARFIKLTDKERAEYLLDALQDYDKATAYTAVGVAVPVRTVDDKQNQELWDNFAHNIQDAVSELYRNGCKQISTNYLDGGAVIMGFRPPPEQSDPFALVGARVVPIPASMLKVRAPGTADEVSSTLNHLMMELAGLGTKGVRAEMKEVQEVVEKHFAGKTVPFLRETITKVEGVASNMEKGDDVPKEYAAIVLPYLRRVAAILRERVELQLC